MRGQVQFKQVAGAGLELFALEPAVDGATAQFKFARNLAGRESLLMQGADLGKEGVGDHAAPPVSCRNRSPTERT